MQLMLTSFGVTEEDFEPSGDWSLFYRMPPVNMHTITNLFMPDYAVLLLCEKVILDKSSFTLLRENPHWSYKLVAEAIVHLYDEGFIKLVDFKHILKRNENLLKKMLEHDLRILDQWIEPLRSSLYIWSHFTTSIRNQIVHRANISSDFDEPEFLMNVIHYSSPFIIRKSLLVKEALESFKKQKRSEFREELREVLRSYLSYVNANIVLSNELGVGFHDWADFFPFYHSKFLAVGKGSINGEHQIKESRKLFEISFPEFGISNYHSLVEALQDKRIADLRGLIEKAVRGDVRFDQEFARNVLKDVLGIERRIGRYRKIISYMTLPISFIPWVGTVA